MQVMTYAKLPIPNNWKYMNYDSLLVVVNRITKISQLSATKSLGPSGTTFELDCGYNLRTLYKNINLHLD